MAKAKKDRITIDEAILPIDEQPYELPENWCWVKHNSILDISGGSQPAKSHFISEPAEGYTQLYQTRDYGEHPIPVYIPDKYATKTTVEGDILLARYGGSLGKVFRAHDGAYNVALAKVIKLYPNLVDDEFLYQYYLSQFYQDFCVKASNGRSAQAGFNREDMDEIPFPLPPLAEQKRIVEQIENLFSMLDEAKEKAQEALDSISKRKSAILASAFSGKLTEKWRNTKGYNFDSWESCKISDVFDLKAGKNISASKIVEEQDATHRYQCFGGNGVRGYVEDYNQDGDFCIIGRQGALCGNINVARGQFYATEHAVLVKYKKPVFLPWAEHYLRYMNLNQYATSVAQPGLAVGKINEVPMIYVPYEEQCEIGKNIESLFIKEDSVKTNIEVVIEKIEILKKTILAKAFRGELGTNIADEESSIELLKQIISE